MLQIQLCIKIVKKEILFIQTFAVTRVRKAKEFVISAVTDSITVRIPRLGSVEVPFAVKGFCKLDLKLWVSFSFTYRIMFYK